MSDLSVLSHEYQTASELSQRINRALLLLKKVYHQLPHKEAITPKDIQASQHYLADVLVMLSRLLDPSGMAHKTRTMPTQVPGALIARLRAERRGDLAYYLEDLERVATRLRSDPGDLTDIDFALLDQVAAVADEETSSVFRQLMRR